MTSGLRGKVTRGDNKTLYLVFLGIFFIVAALVYYAVDRYVLQERLRKEERARAAEQKKGGVPSEVLKNLSVP
ncbi:MAG: hypothetical protein Q8R13_04130 [bacterium]|nr:hypothetical protein [bacterium]MDZ4296482.1 hypothetical protein [Patescibacteria group bacterium]